MPVQNVVTITERLLWIVNIIFHQMVAVIIIYILAITFKNHEINSWHTWHMALVPIGYVVFMAEAIVIYSPYNVPTLFIARPQKKYVHGALMVLSGICVTVGIAIKIYSKSGSHFVSAHALTGLISWILLLVAVLFGCFAGSAELFRKLLRPVWLKLVHNLIGILGFVLGVISLGLGFDKGSFRLYTAESTKITAAVALALLATWTLVDALRSAYGQIRTVLNK